MNFYQKLLAMALLQATPLQTYRFVGSPFIQSHPDNRVLAKWVCYMICLMTCLLLRFLDLNSNIEHYLTANNYAK